MLVNSSFKLSIANAVIVKFTAQLSVNNIRMFNEKISCMAN